MNVVHNTNEHVKRSSTSYNKRNGKQEKIQNIQRKKEYISE